DPRRPAAGRARKIIRSDPSRLHFVAGTPDSLGNLRQRFTDRQGDEDAEYRREFPAYVARQAAVVLDIAERRLQGGRYKVPLHVAESLRTRSSFIQDLKEVAATHGKTLAQAREEAAEYMKEMISIPSTFWLDVYSKFNNFLLGLGYERQIVVNSHAVEKMRHMVREYPSVILWTHKTYLDGSVVPKVMYDNNFPVPHMFGGANMSFAGLGFLLRRSGAIFIRRKFQDNPIYKLTLRHYIGYLMEKRFPMNWSFEGTRSRMGKLMPPRYGLLKYVLEACQATDAENIHIIPVSVSYDLIRDVEEYATEQTGRGKGAESLRWMIGYIRSLARPMGKVYMNIGEPVVLNKSPDPDDSLALSKIAFQVAVEANRVTPVTFPSLVTISLLGAAPQALTEEEVIKDLSTLLGYAEQRKIRISPDFDRSYADHMDGLLGIMIREGMITRYDQGPDVVYGIASDQHPIASYYRNTVIHFFVNKAIAELALLKVSEDSGINGADAVASFWTEVDNLRDLFKFEFFYAPTEEFHREIREELQRYHNDWTQIVGQGSTAILALLNTMTPLVAHVTLLSYIEAYSVVAMLLSRMPATQGLEEQRCIDEALKMGRQALLQGRISSEASIGKLLFRNGFKALQHRGLTANGGAEMAERRAAMARELFDLGRRASVIKAMVVASRGADGQ
ncbi:MAG: glycerol-3-phosphate acyltransferase, partial [Gammaproteobacteria bacterium]|nr:glycerol-3-phosphate acyltransferase [Gammaproteobacteria bacterium]